MNAMRRNSVMELLLDIYSLREWGTVVREEDIDK